MSKVLFISLLVVLVYVNSFAQPSHEYEKFIRLEEGQKSIQVQLDNLNKRYDEIKQEIRDLRQDIKDLRQENKQLYDDLKAFMLWGFGIIFSGIGILIGFVLWDRRTAVEPVAKKLREVQEKEEKLEKALKETQNLRKS